MKIILSPAKTMNEFDIAFKYKELPVFIDQTEILKNELVKYDANELSKLMKCNDSIALLNYQRYQHMNLLEGLSPAVFTYVGLAYQHLACHIMTQPELDYIQNHLIILSGFYGMLKPFDGIKPYRLEMETKLKLDNKKDLYSFWSDKIANELYKENDVILNLASNEYSKCVNPYLNEYRKMITCIFAQRMNGKLKTKPTEAKMCRGYMVRYMAERNIQDLEEIKKFDYKGYLYSEKDSNESEWVFVKEL